MKTELKRILFFLLTSTVSIPIYGIEASAALPDVRQKTQKVRFVEDDAQNYMVSKIYELKHQKANDIVPFIIGSIKRYALNGSADRINYSAGNKQLIAVSCPVPLMPYIDNMIAKLDHPGAKGPDGSGIDGTGIIRSVYTPVWRSSEAMMNVMIKAGIPSNATEGANQDAVVAFDAATNQIYWKDSINKNKDLKKYLMWLDRPVPQCEITLNVYEVREADLLDLGVDYLSWKNGPGLNLFEAGVNFLDGSALTESFGPYGFFMFAPSFDLSYIRLLQQNGRARLATSGSISVASGKTAELSFAPGYQNLKKDEKFRSSINSSDNDQFTMKITSPVIALSGKTDSQTGQLGYSEADYAQQSAIVNFQYNLAVKNVVERDNHGNELYDLANVTGGVTIQTGREHLLTEFIQEQTVEQTIGVPFLCEVPILKYIFGTTTQSREKVFYFVTVNSTLRHPDSGLSAINGKLVPVTELVNSELKGE